MARYEVPHFVWEWMLAAKLEPIEACHSLEWAGRTLGFVRMAADRLETPRPGRRSVAQYHAYAGISAALTSIDATATWLNESLRLGVTAGIPVDLCRSAYRQRVSDAIPDAEEHIAVLGQLKGYINESRKLIQHRRGAPLNFHPYGEGWCFEPPDDREPTQVVHRYLHDLLRNWANQIEPNLKLLASKVDPAVTR